MVDEASFNAELTPLEETREIKILPEGFSRELVFCC